jgi:methylated-DNA-[protein]-cysteine S-methyltransferase
MAARKPQPQMDYEAQILAGELLEAMSFCQKVWALTARVPRGRVTTYAQIARQLGTRGFRAVGAALNRNPYAPAVPCHRVVGAGGDLTGFAHGIASKRKLLEAEGVLFRGGRVDVSEVYRFQADGAGLQSPRRFGRGGG